MREIKFRAWNKGHEKMFEVLSLYPPIKRVQLRGQNNAIPIHCVELMQFTGLHDKNGVEIYEGDILATSNEDDQFNLWAKGDFGYTVVEWSEKWDGWRGTKWTWEKDGESVYCLCFVERIGNIYENPDLLKQRRKHCEGDPVSRETSK